MARKSRGRPRAYDPDTALAAALDTFWERGYSGTSLDRVSAATGMNRPSLYAAFGDKKLIYKKSLDKFRGDFSDVLNRALFAGPSIDDDLVNFYLTALSTYQPGKNVALGCPVICTATTEAAVDDDIQSVLATTLDGLDATLTTRFKQAHNEGQLEPSADPKKLGRLAAALLHSLAVRIRARQRGFDAKSFIKSSVAEILKA